MSMQERQQRTYGALMKSQPYKDIIPQHRLDRLMELDVLAQLGDTLVLPILCELYGGSRKVADPGIFQTEDGKTYLEWARRGSPRFVSIVCSGDGSAECHFFDASSRDEFLATLDMAGVQWFLNEYAPLRELDPSEM